MFASLIVIFSCLPFFSTERHHAGDIYVLARKAGQGVDPAGDAAGAAGGVQGVTVGVSDAAHQPARAAQLGQPGHPGAAQRGRRAARERRESVLVQDLQAGRLPPEASPCEGE